MTDERIWMIKLRDTDNDISLTGSFTADSEVEARLKVKALIERLFLGSQRIYFDRMPEDAHLGLLARSMHQLSQELPLNGYYEGGPDSAD